MVDFEQRSVVKFLWKEGLKPPDIFARLRNVYGDAAYGLSTVYWWRRQFSCGREEITDLDRPGRPLIDDIDSKVLCILQRDPFASCRAIADEVGVDASTVLRRLTQSLGFQSRLLKWVPHKLTDELKQKRVVMALDLLKQLEFEQKFDFARVITGDESWFYLDYTPRNRWTCSGDEVGERVNRTVQSEKCMLTILWG